MNLGDGLGIKTEQADGSLGIKRLAPPKAIHNNRTNGKGKGGELEFGQ
jgi:hypothetical protein